MTDQKRRWQYRFDNYRRAFLQLQEAFEQEELTQLEKEGVVQRFEYTFELAWKTMKDYLEYNGLTLTQITPRFVIRAAFEAKLISDGEVWMNALDDRNALFHTYDFSRFESVIAHIKESYLMVFDNFYDKLTEACLETE